MTEAALLVEGNTATVKHINRVQELLFDVVAKLLKRARQHDASKLREPEASALAAVTPRLKGLVYMSPEYVACLEELKPALDHHYALNTHHPEHWPNGIQGMSLLDLIEMIVDWKAAGERDAMGCMNSSLEENAKRYHYGPELDSILRQTAMELWPGEVMPPYVRPPGGTPVFEQTNLQAFARGDSKPLKQVIDEKRLAIRNALEAMPRPLP